MSKFMEETVIINYNIKYHNYCRISCLLMTELQRLNEVMTEQPLLMEIKQLKGGFSLTAQEMLKQLFSSAKWTIE
jgi:hypothetical protein